MSIITVRDLGKEYVTYRRGNTFLDAIKSLFHREKVIVKAVSGVSFEIEDGQIVGILGKNGAGKSTLIKMMTGILKSSYGEINVMGYKPFLHRKKYVTNIGAVFGQKSQLIWDIPPIDSFYLNKAIYVIPNQEFKERLDMLVDLFEVRDIITKPTRVLSLGERMKCEFIMAMLHNPKIVFLDEPTIGLDLLAKDKIRDFILEMNKKGVTFILTTHDLGDIELLAERIIVINHGEKVFEDTLSNFKKYLGDKKIVHIVMKTPLPENFADGITISQKINESEAELLVDNSIIPMNELISYINGIGSLLDMSIKEMSVEEILKVIYNES